MCTIIKYAASSLIIDRCIVLSAWCLTFALLIFTEAFNLFGGRPGPLHAANVSPFSAGGVTPNYS